MSLRLAPADLDDPMVQALIAAHQAHSHSTSPPESVFALDLDGLRADDVTLFAAWQGPALVGCGALRQLGPREGELKSMHIARAHRGKGHARALLAHLIAHARALGLQQLWLETGSMEAYAPARALYASAGFRTCGRFGDYPVDPNSTYMTREI
ncbi:GNAT family N-acetyltransferase [Oceanibium sediminis]|uniref:GNAT family N-acetyltransferase n=1 Tax=Oceanibium sediminis TaxID=2026339 RepID=UPI000DD2EB11|nr:GNAT family N-acetyltransferase [Oceanibium sediminis]